MKEHIKEYKKTLNFLVSDLDELPHLWHFSVEQLDDAKYLANIPWLGRDAAVDTVAALCYFVRQPNTSRTFCDISNNIVMHYGFNMDVASALVVWNFITVRLQEHSIRHGHLPVDLKSMLADFIDNGDIDADKEY